MTRPIKFRAWDEKEKKMFVPSHIDGHGTLVVEERHVEDYDEQGRPSRYGTHPIEYPNPYVLMQFTGLHDKNGKEIYEGDVFEWRLGEGDSYIQTNNDPLPLRKVVYWDEDDACWGMKNAALEPCGSGYTFSKRNLETMAEVIGNIYENPELLQAN